MSARTLRPIAATVVALVINTVLFCSLPLLTDARRTPEPPDYGDAFLLAQLPPPLPKNEEPQVLRRPPRETPRETPRTHLPRPERTPRPRPDVTPPDIAFDPAPPLAAAMRVDPSMLASAAPSISTPSAGFELGEVDTPPRLTRPVRPVYPYTARRKGITGVVTVRFLVDAAGNVSRPVIVRAEPQGVFEAAVLDAVARWRFHPGVYQGSAVPTWVEVPLRFDLDS